MVGIYKITNPKGKVYVGQSKDIDKRFKSYKRLNCKSQIKLFNSLKKYGVENHKFQIIEECKLKDTDFKEIYWGLYYKVLDEGLNCKLGQANSIVSDLTKNKMSQSHIGLTWSKERKKKLSKTKTDHPMYNDEWRDSISKSLIGRKITWCKKISESRKGMESNFKGKKHSKETINEMSLYRKNHYKNSHKQQPVLQYHLNGKFIKEWNSIKEVKQSIKGDISACCRGKQKTAGGFIWKYKR